MGNYIIIEGDEGAGKTTQVDMLAQRLRGLDRRVETVREPGGDRLGELLRLVLKADPQNERYCRLRDDFLGGEDIDLGPEVETLAFLAARQSMRRNIVYPRLVEGADVISDRGEVSTLVYQGVAGHIDMDFLSVANEFVAKVAPPTVTIVLDIPLEVSQARQVGRNQGQDRFEARGEDYRRSVNDGYRQIANECLYPLIDADQPVREVHEEIWSVIRPLL